MLYLLVGFTRLLYLSLYHYLMHFFVFYYSLCLKVYFVWCKYCYPSFLFAWPGGSLPRTVFPIVTVLWSPKPQAPLAIRARWSRGIPYVDCTCPSALVRQLGRTPAVYKSSGRMSWLHTPTSFSTQIPCTHARSSKAQGECCDLLCLLVPANSWPSKTVGTFFICAYPSVLARRGSTQ